MTTGFGLFELLTCGLLQRGRDHSPPKACFYLRSSALGWQSQFCLVAVYKYTATKQNGVGLMTPQYFHTIPTSCQLLTISDYVYLQATGEEVDKSWRNMVDELQVGCQCADSTVLLLLLDSICSFNTCTCWRKSTRQLLAFSVDVKFIISLDIMAGRWKQNCIGPAYQYTCIRVHAYVRVYAEGRGSGGMLPQEHFLNFGCCEMASEAILGPKTLLLIFTSVLAW